MLEEGTNGQREHWFKGTEAKGSDFTSDHKIRPKWSYGLARISSPLTALMGRSSWIEPDRAGLNWIWIGKDGICIYEPNIHISSPGTSDRDLEDEKKKNVTPGVKIYIHPIYIYNAKNGQTCLNSAFFFIWILHPGLNAPLLPIFVSLSFLAYALYHGMLVPGTSWTKKQQQGESICTRKSEHTHHHHHHHHTLFSP